MWLQISIVMRQWLIANPSPVAILAKTKPVKVSPIQNLSRANHQPKIRPKNVSKSVCFFMSQNYSASLNKIKKVLMSKPAEVKLNSFPEFHTYVFSDRRKISTKSYYQNYVLISDMNRLIRTSITIKVLKRPLTISSTLKWREKKGTGSKKIFLRIRKFFRVKKILR